MALPTDEEHPLHILDNQTDPYKKSGKFNVPQKPIRTFEKDMEEALRVMKESGKEPKPRGGLFSIFRRKEEVKAPTLTSTSPVSQPILTPIKQQQTFPNPKPIELYEKAVTDTMERKKTAEMTPASKSISNIDKSNISPLQKPMRTLESDMAEALGKKNEVPLTPKVEEKKLEVKTDRSNESELYKKIEEDRERREKAMYDMQAKVDLNIKQAPIRTYEGDVSKAVTENKTSVVKMALAESNRRRGEDILEGVQTVQVGKNTTFAFLSVIFIISGIVGGYYLYLHSSFANKVVITTPTKSTSIIKPDSQKTVNLQTLQKSDLFDRVSTELKNSNPSQGKIEEFVLTHPVGSTTQKVTGSQFIVTPKFNVTDTLERSIIDKWMLGVYSSEQNIPFIILTTDFFQNAFAGMLKWENSMPAELSTLLNYQYPEGTRGIFRDRSILNRDIREFVNERGEILVLYTFIDKNTLLITTSEAMIPVILDRIEKQTYVR